MQIEKTPVSKPFEAGPCLVSINKYLQAAELFRAIRLEIAINIWVFQWLPAI